MKLKHSFTVFGLVAMLGLGVGVGLASRNAPAREVKAENIARVNFLIKEDSALYDNAKPLLGLVFNAATNPEASGKALSLTMDSDLEHESDGYGFMEFGTGNWYAVLTTTIDLDVLHAGDYDNVGFARFNPDGGAYWNTWWINAVYDKIAPANFLETNNTFVVNSNNSYDTGWGNYWKITAYSGKTSYDSLAGAQKDVYLKSSGYGFAPANPAAPNGYEFVGWFTEKTFENAWTGESQPTADTTLYAKYEAVSANFVLENGSDGGALQYNSQNDQFEGVITGANTKFKVRKYIGENYTDYAALESGMSEHTDVAVIEGGYVKLVADYPVMIYFKNDSHEIWATQASGELIAYAYAGYFLTNVGCDPNGVNLPSGWTTVKNRYENPAAVTNDAKDFLFAFDVEAKRATKPNDDIVRMFDRYNLACNRHPSLDKFIKDSGGNARPIPAPASSYTPIMGQISNEINVTLVIAVAASVALVLVLAGYFYFRKRKEDR